MWWWMFLVCSVKLFLLLCMFLRLVKKVCRVNFIVGKVMFC